MGERRLFSTKITESDAFLDLPASSQALYFHLCLNADDDGVVSSPQRVMRMVRARTRDLKTLLENRFLLELTPTVIVVKHWLIHNKVNKQRYKVTKYADLMSNLYLKEDGVYTDNEDFCLNKWHPVVERASDKCTNDVDTKFDPSQVKSSQDKLREDISSSSSISPSSSCDRLTDRLTDDEFNKLSASVEDGELLGLIDKLDSLDAASVEKPLRYCLAVARDMGVLKEGC